MRAGDGVIWAMPKRTSVYFGEVFCRQKNVMLFIMVLQWVDAFQLLAGALLAQPSIASPASSQPPPFSAQLMLFLHLARAFPRFNTSHPL